MSDACKEVSDERAAYIQGTDMVFVQILQATMSSTSEESCELC